MIHYHGTPISPVSAFFEMAGRHLCVSFARPDDIARCHQLGQSVMLDNGAFSAWRTNEKIDWREFFAWCEPWLQSPSTWAVIPDEIDAGAPRQDELLAQWPFGHKGAPVWHMDEPLDRLLYLTDFWPRVCIGSTREFARILSAAMPMPVGRWRSPSTRGRIRFFADVPGSLDEDGYSQAVAACWGVRRLTPLECERLQGLPDNWTDIPWRGKPHAPDGPRYRAIGNAWPLNVADWIASRITEWEARA